MEKQKANYKPLLFTATLALCAAAAVFYFSVGEEQSTTPKIKLGYFNDNTEFVNSIKENLPSEIGKQKYFWVGYEPEKENQIDLTKLLKQEIEKQIEAFDIVVIDKELTMPEEHEKALGMTHEIMLKENFAEVADLVKANKDKNILVITAAIYSTNMIKANPHAKINDLTKVKPLVFSMGYFPAAAEEERNLVFKCDTEDKTGTSPWGCTVLNKSRAIRRRIDLGKLNVNPPPRIGLMDLTGESDYMILLGK